MDTKSVSSIRWLLFSFEPFSQLFMVVNPRLNITKHCNATLTVCLCTFISCDKQKFRQLTIDASCRRRQCRFVSEMHAAGGLLRARFGKFEHWKLADLQIQMCFMKVCTYSKSPFQKHIIKIGENLIDLWTFEVYLFSQTLYSRRYIEKSRIPREKGPIFCAKFFIFLTGKNR